MNGNLNAAANRDVSDDSVVSAVSRQFVHRAALHTNRTGLQAHRTFFPQFLLFVIWGVSRFHVNVILKKCHHGESGNIRIRTGELSEPTQRCVQRLLIRGGYYRSSARGSALLYPLSLSEIGLNISQLQKLQTSCNEVSSLTMSVDR